MKRISIDLLDLIEMLKAMYEDGTNDIIFFEHKGLPALADKEDESNIVTFEIYDKTEETKNGDKVH